MEDGFGRRARSPGAIALAAVLAAASLGACRWVTPDPSLQYPCATDDDCLGLEGAPFCADELCRAEPAGPDAGVDGGTECLPSSCAQLGYECGAVDDGCGTPLSCGTCEPGQGCGAQGTPGVCQACGTEDLPDDAFLDSNCDGIDGQVDGGVFLDPVNGDDLFVGSINQPVRTLGRAVTLAQAGPRIIYISGGVSDGGFALVDAGTLSLYGGYRRTSKWARNGASTVEFLVPPTGARVEASSDPLLLDRVAITASAAEGATSASVAMVVIDSQAVTLRHVKLSAGRGKDGMSGMGGADAANGAPGGTPGGSLGGSAGTGCGGNGGQGGSGGGTNAPQSGQAGSGGAMGGSGGSNAGCSAMPPSTAGSEGGDGLEGAAGTDGASGASVGTWTDASYAPADGTSGDFGKDGSGGGGGGGGGGLFCAVPTALENGGGGGGGGAGGCGGGGGDRGRGGGASVALLLVDSAVSFETGVQLVTAGGGNGGAGGDGGVGGVGGPPGLGAQGNGPNTSRGGNGGGGGNGGRGGHGGGGGGGPSVGVWCVGTSSVTGTPGTSLGPPGAGGPSAGNQGASGFSDATFGCP